MNIHERLLAAYDAVIYLDTETRSRVDLLRCGGWKYAQDDSTQVLMICTTTYANGHMDSLTHTIYPDLYIALVDTLRRSSAGSGRSVNNIALLAHNMDGFEYPLLLAADVFKQFDASHPDVVIDCFDTATFLRMNGVPARLDHAARVLLDEPKLASGTRLINRYSKPKNGKFEPLEAPGNKADLRDMIAYCNDDTLKLPRICQQLYLPRDITLEDYLRQADSIRHLNKRGVSIAVDEVEDIQAAVETAQAALNSKISTLTGGAVPKASGIPKLKTWLQANTTQYTGGSLTADVRAKLIADPHVDDNARHVLRLVDTANSASVKKYAAYLNYMCPDEVVRGCYVDHGAGQTTRLSSRGVQLHNLNRDTLSSVEFDTLTKDDGRLPPEVIMDRAGRAVRQMIIPRRAGYRFVLADWSNIEARITPWLANTPESLEKLSAYADPDRDPYVEAANDTGFSEQDDARQIGKVIELALGFLGGAGALQSMASKFKLGLSTGASKAITNRWREANTWAVVFGDDCIDAAGAALRKPRHYVPAGQSHVTYCYDPDQSVLSAFVGPVDRVEVRYRNPRRFMGDIIFDSPAHYSPTSGKTIPKTLWRGLAVENVTQAFAALLLRTVVGRAVFYDYGVMTTHDDVVLEAPDRDIGLVSGLLTRAMVGDLAPITPGLALDIELKVRDRLEK